MNTSPANEEQPRIVAGTLAAFFALLCWACPGLVARGLALAPIPIVTYRIALGTLLSVAILYLTRGRMSWRLLRASWLAGVFLGIDLLSFFTAIKTTTVANATVIGSLQPLLLVFLAPLLFGERIRWPDLTAAAVAMGGVTMVVFGSHGQPSWNLRGDLWAVATLISWTGYFLACKRARRHVAPNELTAGTALVAGLVVLPFTLASPGKLPMPTPGQWLGLGAMALLGWAGHFLMSWALGHIPVWVGGTASLANPVVTTLLAALFLAEPLAGVQLGGMAIVVVSLSVVSVRGPEVQATVEEGTVEVIEPPLDEHVAVEVEKA